MCADGHKSARTSGQETSAEEKGNKQAGPFSNDRNWHGNWPKTPGRLLGVGFIRAYQLTLSPIIGRSCRHLPTCSEYGYEAIARHGLLRGGWLTFWRVLKCNPLGTSGIDPVPEKMRWFKK